MVTEVVHCTEVTSHGEGGGRVGGDRSKSEMRLPINLHHPCGLKGLLTTPELALDFPGDFEEDNSLCTQQSHNVDTQPGLNAFLLEYKA